MSVLGTDGEPDKWGEPVLGTPVGPIEWYADLSGLVGNASQVSFVAKLEDAFTLWEDVAGVEFVQVANAEADFSFTVAPLEEIAPTLEGIEDAAGLAERFLISGSEVDEIIEVDIYFDVDVTWNLNDNFFKVATHEIGHGIGLDHIYDPTQIMNPTVLVEELGDLDIAAAQTLYGEAGAPPPPDDDEDPVSSSSSSGSSGGAEAGLLIGLLAAIAAFFFGGGTATAAVVAVGRVDDGDAQDDALPDLNPDDMLPMIETDQHLVFLGEDGLYHSHGCGCATCCGTDQTQLEESFMV